MKENNEYEVSVEDLAELGGTRDSCIDEADRLIGELLNQVFEAAQRQPRKRWSPELSELRAAAGQQLAAHAAFSSAGLQSLAGEGEAV